MRLMAALIVLALLGCAVLAANAHKPFTLRIDGPDANPAAWPRKAALVEPAQFVTQPYAMECRPRIIIFGKPPPRPTVRT